MTYENRALKWHEWWKEFLQFEINKLSSVISKHFLLFSKTVYRKKLCWIDNDIFVQAKMQQQNFFWPSRQQAAL